MWRRVGVGVMTAVVALGLLAGCGGGGDDDNAEESFTADELSAIQTATDDVAVYCTNQVVERTTGRVIAGGPRLADAEAGIDTLASLGREKPEALWEPETTSETEAETERSATEAEPSTTEADTSTSEAEAETSTGEAESSTTEAETSTTGTETTAAATGPRTIAETLADLEQPVRAGCGEDLSARLSSALAELTGTTTSTTPTAPTGTGTETAPSGTAPTATSGTAPAAPSAPGSPTPSVLSGTGPVASEVEIPGTSPLVATATYAGSGTFRVGLEPTSGAPGATLFERVGRYSGQTLLAQPQPGLNRVRIEASGRWSLRLAQPQPSAEAAAIPGRINGTGSRVIPVQAAQALRARVAGQHRGGQAFRVALVGYGTTAGTIGLFEQSGRFQGETVTDVPAGPYLLQVQAGGAWTVTFTPAG